MTADDADDEVVGDPDDPDDPDVDVEVVDGGVVVLVTGTPS